MVRSSGIMGGLVLAASVRHAKPSVGERPRVSQPWLGLQQTRTDGAPKLEPLPTALVVRCQAVD